MHFRATSPVSLALSFALMSNALPSSSTSSIPKFSSVTNSSSLASNSAPQSSSIPTVSTIISSSWPSISVGTSANSSGGPGSSSGWPLNPNGTYPSSSPNSLTTASTTSLSDASPAVSWPSASLSHWSPSEVQAASNGSLNSSGFPRLHVDQKEKNMPGVTASGPYSASGSANSASPASITSMRNPFNAAKAVNQTNVCGGPISVASNLITSGLFSANDCLPLNWNLGVLNMSYGGTCSMSPGFDGYNAKSCSCVNSAAKWYHDYATATVTSQQCQSTYDMNEAMDIQTLGCSYNTITELAMSYPAPTSCCDKCEVAASAVQVVFWPPADAPSNSSVGTNITGSTNWNVTAAPVQSAASYGLIEDGFTFISPSVYVIYSSIQASASCVALFNSHIPIGSAYTAVTRAYEPNVLSSAICEAENMGAGIEYCISPVGDQDDPNYCFQGIDNGWRQINFSELYDPPPASDLLTRYQSCFPGHSINADFASMMFVKPQLAFPPDVTDIDPVWATWGGNTCTPVNLGVFDPPRVLQKATALAPVPTPATDPQAENAPPSPAATLTSPLATPTTKVVSGADPNSGIKANDPGSNNAGTATPTIAQSDPVAVVIDPVDPSIVAQNEGSPATGNSVAVKAGSDTDSNSDPGAVVVDPVNGSISEQNEASPTTENSDVVNSSSSPNSNSDSSSGNIDSNSVADGGDTAPADTEKQSGANTATSPGTNSGTNSGTGNNDPSTAPITLLPQQSADTAKENSGTSGTSGKTGVTTGGTNGGSNGGTIGGTNGGTSEDSNGDTNVGTNSGANVGNNGGSDGANSGSTSGDTSGGDEGDSNGGTKIGTSGGSDGDGNANPAPIAFVNSQPITKDASGNIVLSGSTLASGSTAVFSGHTIANAPSAIVMDGSTYAPSPTTPSPSPLIVNNQLLQMTNGGLEIGSQTLVPGAFTTINNHVIDYANPSQVIEDGVTHNLAPVSSSNPLVLNGNTLQRAANGGLITAGTTIAPGSTAAISGHVYSLAGSSSVIMDGNTYALPAATNAYQIQAATSSAPNRPSIASGPLTLANGLVITAQPSISSGVPQNYILPNGASLSAGGSTAVFSGTTYSALPSDAGIVAAGPSGSSTLAIPTIPPTATRSIYTAAGATFTPQATGFTIGGATLTPGGQALTTGGTVVSLGTSGTFVMGSSTMVLPSQSIFAAAGATFTAQADGFDIGTTSLTPGGAAYTTDGTVISLGTNSVLAIGSTTYDLGPQSVFTVDGHTFTAQPTGFMIGSQTVLPGSTGVDEGGETVSLGANGELQIGSKTVTLASSTGLSGAIVFGLGGGSGSGVVFEGAAWRIGVWGLGMVVGVVGTIVAVVL